MGQAAPALYTVEEAAKLLRIGRTKAYALTQEWRATGGKSGLPVVDFGHVLRVPRAALENLLGIDLAGTAPAPAASAEPAQARQTETNREPVSPETAPVPSRKRRPRATNTDSTDQLDLFHVAS